MMNPNITFHDAITGETVVRPMTNEEYSELLASGWMPDDEPEQTE